MNGGASVQISEAELVAQLRESWPRDPTATTAFSAQLRDRFPKNHSGYQVGAAAARALRKFDEARSILTEATRRFADQAWITVEHAWLAQACGDTERAGLLATDLRERIPDHYAGYHIGAATARACRNFDDAHAILSEAERRFSDQAWVMVEQALLAQACGDTERARQLAADLRARIPTHYAGYQVGSAAARAAKEFDDAEAILTEAARRFPDQAWVVSDQAWLAHARGDVDRAISLAEALRAKDPANPTGYALGAGMLRIHNRLSESVALLAAARIRFPSDPRFSSPLEELRGLAANRADAHRLVRSLDEAKDGLLVSGGRESADAGKVVVIVGMHRAGTSLCAKVVNRLGFELGGPLLTPTAANPDGFHEHAGINESHEALLAILGASWDTSWTVRASMEESLGKVDAQPILDRLKAIAVRELKASGGRWAFKDPRTAGFIPIWDNIFAQLGVEPTWVLAIRDPRAVAASLYARNRLSTEIGELLWVEHYLNALRYLGSRIDCIVHYENWFSSPRDQLDAVSAVMGSNSKVVIEHAAQSVIHELRHNTPRHEAPRLALAQEVHSWLCVDRPDFGALQKRATSVWNALRARAASRPGDEIESGL